MKLQLSSFVEDSMSPAFWGKLLLKESDHVVGLMGCLWSQESPL
jgi:hypothetical protein